MSETITVAHVRQYNANIVFLYQQKGSKFRGKVREKVTKAKYDFFDRLGPTAAQKKTVRHGDTPLMNSNHTRRRAELSDYEWADLTDPQDEIRIIIQPTSAYVVNAAYAMGRSFDDEVILAFNASAREGEDGSTTTSFPAAQQIAHGSTGLTVAKLQDTKLLFDNADVDEEGRWFAVSPEGILDLLADPQVTSSDFNTVKALVSGSVTGPYMGFNYMTTTRLPVASNIRKCFAWQQNAMGMCVGMDLTTRISERDDKGYATQVYLMGSFGGVRTLDEGVAEVSIDESV